MPRAFVFPRLPFLILAVSMVGCATPAPLVGLRPADPGFVWIAGRATIHKQQDDVRVAAAFEHQDGDTLAVRVEVENQGNETLEVGPSAVTFVTCKGMDTPSCAEARRVISPERMLQWLDEQQSRNAADATNEATFQGTMLLLSAVGDVATIASGKGNSTTGLQTSAIADSMEHGAARHESAAQSIAAQRQLWSNAALRRNTVFPGRGTGGLVYMPIDMSARFVWIAVRLAGRGSIVFRFEQTVTEVN